MSYKVLSLDVWDTIVRRKCDPDAVKLNTSRWILNNYYNLIKDDYRSVEILTKLRVDCEIKIGNKYKESGCDDEYEIHEVFSELVDIVFLINEINIQQIVNEITNNELQFELDITYLDPSISEKIRNIEYEKLIIISDFYMSSNFIKEILDNCGFEFKIEQIFSSCDVRFNKRSGKLFDYVLSELKLSSSDMIHIGDNVHSDVYMPSSKDIKAIHYVINEEIQKKKIASSIYSSRATMDYSMLVKFNILSQNKDSLFDIGSNISIVFTSYVMYIIEDAMRKGAEKIYYFTREGELYKKIHDEIQNSNIFGKTMPKAELLEVSRLATFGPSLREFSLKELMRVWNLYSTQSMKALFKTIDVQIENFNHYFEMYSIDTDEIIVYPWLNEKIIMLFDNKEFTDAVHNELLRKRELLIKYFESKGITKDCKDLYVVDIGWRGTIQDNISYIFDNTFINGYYFGLFGFINEQPQNTKKMAYLSPKEVEWILRNVAPFEMLCNSSSGSVLRYNIKDSIVFAERLNEKCEDLIHDKYISDIQKGIVDNVKKICIFLRENAFGNENINGVAVNLLEKTITCPPKVLAEAFFNLSHNEIFGVGDFVDKKINFPIKIFIKAIFTTSGKKEFKKFIEDTTWPQGFLTKFNLEIVLNKYNEFMRERLYQE